MEKYIVRIQWIDIREKNMYGEFIPKMFIHDCECFNENFAIGSAMGVFINRYCNDSSSDFLHYFEILTIECFCKILNVDFCHLRDDKNN